MKADEKYDRVSFRALRHRSEMPLIWLSFFVTLIGLLLAAAILSLDEESVKQAFGDDAEATLENARLALGVLALPLFLFVFRFYMAAKAKANAVRVGPTQFPRIWEIYEDLVRRLELPVTPRLYVTNGNGVVNAYALSCNTRWKYVVIHSEIAMLVDRAPEIVQFVLAHELGHHKLNHVSLWRLVIGAIPNAIPTLGVSTTRAQEYSADRVAMKLCAGDHHHGAMSLLAVGPWIEGQVGPDAWLEQCEQENREFFVRLANLTSNHPVLVKRYKALRDISAHGFSRHGSMF